MPSPAIAPPDQHALARWTREIERTLALYRGLADMLDAQYRHAQHMDAAALLEHGETIAGQVARLEAHQRASRARLPDSIVRMARDNAPPRGGANPTRVALLRRCQAVRELALHCRAMSRRNGELLASRYECLHRMLHGDRHTYAPR